VDRDPDAGAAPATEQPVVWAVENTADAAAGERVLAVVLAVLRPEATD
jgi:hypothetical protein